MAEQWFLRGNYLENCNCPVSCPCTMDITLKPTSPDASCHVTSAFHLREGRYGAIDLSGLGAILVINSPPGQAMGDGHLSAALYLDERASPEQQEALRVILAGEAGGPFAALAPLIGSIVGVRTASIRFAEDGSRRSVQVAGVTDATIAPIAGAIDPARPITLDNLNVYNPGQPLTQAIVVSSSYRDHGLEWDNTGCNAYLTALDMKGP